MPCFKCNHGGDLLDSQKTKDARILLDQDPGDDGLATAYIWIECDGPSADPPEEIDELQKRRLPDLGTFSHAAKLRHPLSGFAGTGICRRNAGDDGWECLYIRDVTGGDITRRVAVNERVCGD
ncbi:MAG: hypothetical protein ACYSVY_17560 [Planctomycetota bacterium]|jgi:hypothetical protein